MDCLALQKCLSLLPLWERVKGPGLPPAERATLSPAPSRRESLINSRAGQWPISPADASVTAQHTGPRSQHPLTATAMSARHSHTDGTKHCGGSIRRWWFHCIDLRMLDSLDFRFNITWAERRKKLCVCKSMTMHFFVRLHRCCLNKSLYLNFGRFPVFDVAVGLYVSWSVDQKKGPKMTWKKFWFHWLTFNHYITITVSSFQRGFVVTGDIHSILRASLSTWWSTRSLTVLGIPFFHTFFEYLNSSFGNSCARFLMQVLQSSHVYRTILQDNFGVEFGI